MVSGFSASLTYQNLLQERYDIWIVSKTSLFSSMIQTDLFAIYLQYQPFKVIPLDFFCVNQDRLPVVEQDVTRLLQRLNERSTLQLGSTIGTSSSTLGLRVMAPRGASSLHKNKPAVCAAYSH